MVRSRNIFTPIVAFAIMVLPSTFAQDPRSNEIGSVTGVVTDSTNAPVTGATVRLLSKDSAVLGSAMTDGNGAYLLSAVRPGEYMFEVEKTGLASPNPVPLILNAGEAKKLDLHFGAGRVAQSQNAGSSKPDAPAQSNQPQFFDEPKFTVAGVTDVSQYGGHGSDAALRNSESLAKSAVALSRTPPADAAVSPEPAWAKVESTSKPAADPGYITNLSRAKDLVRKRKYQEALPYLQEALKLPSADAAAQDKAALHELLGIVQEEVGNPLEAVREYQIAAELDPNEPDLFRWGAELLLHGAFEPASEVFSKGSQRSPESIRMRLGLSVAWYARGSQDEAAQMVCTASDLNPQDPDPYIFMGRMQSANAAPPDCFTERFGRFASLQPQNAMANYFYAVNLWKSRKRADDREVFAQAKALLEKSIRLDPKLAPAYLQLGIMEEEVKNPQQAIIDYKKSIELDPQADEPHYRLAQHYARLGKRNKAEEELQLYRRKQAQQAGEAERERRNMRQFLYTLKDPGAMAQP